MGYCRVAHLALHDLSFGSWGCVIQFQAEWLARIVTGHHVLTPQAGTVSYKSSARVADWDHHRF